MPLAFLVLGCKQKSDNHDTNKEATEPTATGLTFNCSNKELVEAFNWAKNKALSYAHDGSDPVGYWYEAALPNHEAFCMRDVSHQAIGAELLGLSDHNYNMFLKFAQNISEDKDYCTYWEINRYDLPAPVDYENDKDFWYNLPANFDVVYNAHRLYNWTGNKAYLENGELRNFYKLSMEDYVDHWDLGYKEVRGRNRDLHVQIKDSTRFGNKRGIPTYNEGGSGETVLGIDMTASLASAYMAYAQLLRLQGNLVDGKKYQSMGMDELRFLNDFWWDTKRNAFRSILYEDGHFDYFMVGDDQAFLHYLLYFNVLSDQKKIKQVVDGYAQNFDKLIVELKSYLPIIFYENGHTALANRTIVDLCSAKNKRRDYPENSFTIIEHLSRGLMGLNVEAEINSFTSSSRMENENQWAEMRNIPVISNKIALMHEGNLKTVATNLVGPPISWIAEIPGVHEFLYVNGKKVKCDQMNETGKAVSYYKITLKEGDEVMVSVNSQ